MESPPAAEAPPVNNCPWEFRVLRWLRTCLIFAFVSWQLFVLFVRNPLDLCGKEVVKYCEEEKKFAWWEKVKPYYEKIDGLTKHYENLMGCEQGWAMFSPDGDGELARSVSFLSARIELSDGSSEELQSPNQVDPAGFFRVGGWRQRKLEDRMADSSTPDEDFMKPYVRWSVRRWRSKHPNDPRTVKTVVLIARKFTFPEPDEDYEEFEIPKDKEIGRFLPDGERE